MFINHKTQVVKHKDTNYLMMWFLLNCHFSILIVWLLILYFSSFVIVYVLPVVVTGVSVQQRIWWTKTQQSSFLSHWSETARPEDTMNLILTSWCLAKRSSTIPLYLFLPYMATTYLLKPKIFHWDELFNIVRWLKSKFRGIQWIFIWLS